MKKILIILICLFNFHSVLGSDWTMWEGGVLGHSIYYKNLDRKKNIITVEILTNGVFPSEPEKQGCSIDTRLINCDDFSSRFVKLDLYEKPFKILIDKKIMCKGDLFSSVSKESLDKELNWKKYKKNTIFGGLNRFMCQIKK